MKSVAIISVVLAASQCMAEPSGPSPSTADVGVADSSVDAEVADAGAPSAPSARATSKLLEVGPEPFTVPTHRIAWPQQKASILVPQGARVEGDGSSALVLMGEGRNFAYRVSELDEGPDPALFVGETESLDERDDGAWVRHEQDRWFFRVQGDRYTCWNPATARHGVDDVEMMIASCLSIESGTNGDD